MVTLAVNNFVVGHTFACRFASSSMLQVVIAQQINENRIECITPASQFPEHTTIEVAVNSQEFGTSSPKHEFAFHPAIQIQEVYPPRGPAAGGTEAMITGAFYPSRSASLSYLVCLFNSSSGIPVRLSASQLSCTTPLHAHGIVNVEVCCHV